MYAQNYTRSDISFAVSMLGHYQANLRLYHWRATRKVLKYLQGITNHMLAYRRTSNLEKSGKQSVITTSTMEVEFVACFEATIQSLWVHNFVDGLGIVGTISKPMGIYCDNSTSVFFSKNDRYYKGAKHMDLKYLSVKEEVQNQRVQIVHIGTNDMIMDPLTKGLAPKTFIGHVSEME
ncbi:hypothetical protein V6N11_001548 [Hibiscus sabdariffa]|uniref:Retrovirus-related Pol polyprotein from transposon TNT 1-94 n=1 Tax=Hibiscus sabdariffa TaxID=183260 RepID=A0ABR2S0V3_9ROSI